MNEKLLITSYSDKLISVLYRDSKPMEIHVENHSLMGAVFLARVSCVVQNIEAAFLEIVADHEKMQAFYSLKDNRIHNFADHKKHSKLLEGDEVVVQITKDAVKTKAPIASAHLVLGGQYAVVSRGRGRLCFSSKIKDRAWKEALGTELEAMRNAVNEGGQDGLAGELQDESNPDNAGGFTRCDFLIRTSAFTEGVPAKEIFREAFLLEKRLSKILISSRYQKAPALLLDSEAKYLAICKKYKPSSVVTDSKEVLEQIEGLGMPEIRPVFYQDANISLSKLYSIQTLMDGLLQKRVWMKSGAYLVIEYTEALTVIDVNSGKIDIRKEAEETRMRVNMEAAACAMEQIRLRNLSGIILIDFIDMKKEHQKPLMEALEELAKEDRIKTNIVDVTALGLVEITRQRNARPLYEEMKAEATKE